MTTRTEAGGNPPAGAQRALERITAALDGSEDARQAFDYAGVIAEGARVRIELLHVVEGDPAAPRRTRAPEKDLARVREVMESCANWCGLHGVTCSTRLESGTLLDRLVECARPDALVAVGMAGRFRGTGFGSTTRSLLHDAPGPILIAGGPPLRPVNRLLAVFDGTPASHRATLFATRLSQQIGWPPTVLAVPSAKASLDEALEGAQSLAPAAQVIAWEESRQPEAIQIERAAARTKHAIVVAGAFPDSWLHQVLSGGGTTGHLLQHLGAPVIVVP